nr:hemagglutinin repeat-containing protein [uncultured Phascolarctobacterium sp.]
MKGSNVASEAGKADLAAENNINIANETEYHERLHEYHSKVSGVLSSKTTDIYDYSNQNTVVGSSISVGELAISSKKDTNIKGSNVVADNDVSVKTGGNLNIGSAEQTSESEYIKSVKKSGVFAGGGLGFTIGKEKQKDQYANQNVEQVGSTVGSVKGNVNMDADKAANVKGSTVVAGKDINITGENVKNENSNSVYNAQEKHEFKRTGLSVSVGGAYVDVVNNAANSVKHAADVEDKRLGALVAVKGYKDADKAIKNIKSNGGGKVTENLSINVSLGTTNSKSESKSTTVVANASEVKAGVDVNVTSTKKDINITGSNVKGKDVTLNAKENLNITASKTTNKLEQNSKSSSASVGASLELGKGPSYSISGSMSKGEVSANGTSYNESNVTANKDLNFASGNDTNIKGGKLSVEKVTSSVGGDLNIESKQDSNNYKESNKSVGASVGLGSNKAVSGSASVGKIDSKYESVIEQSGIYAGKDGFEINVGENTDLKGGIITSTADADKNKISTGTLTFEDIQNKADYKAGGAGIKVNKNNDAEYNEKGITPDIGMPASGEAESTTKATISKGTIEIRDKENQKQDINKLNRDTANSLNKLGEIFDKTKVEERQELANLFGELAYNEIHYMDGSNEQKALYHAVVGGIMSKLTGGDFLAGATAAGINKLVIEEIVKVADGDPDKAQWVSAVLGAVISDLVSGNTQAGASVAASATKYNRFEDVYGTFDLKKLGVSNRQIVTVYLSEIQYALSHCDVYNAGTEQEIIKLDFGNGDYLDIKFGHGYRDDHKSQSRGIVPPFSSTDRKHVLSALISAAIIGYAEHKYNNTQYPVFGRGRPEYLSCNMYLYNPKTLRNELTKIEFSIGRKANGRIEISDFYPIAVIGGR